jgi:molybdopterin synthase catalytic subunit
MGRQIQRVLTGELLDLPKYLLLAAAIPMHWIVLLTPMPHKPIAIVAILTIYHNLQYHRLIWFHNKKYTAGSADKRGPHRGSPDGVLVLPAPTFPGDFFELTTEPIDVGAVARRVVLPECGATVTLDGYAREWTRGRRTLYLVYEAYAPMAQRELERLGHEAHERFAIAHIGIVHRTGRLEIGETSIVIAVSAPHRRAAFEACEWAIRELKRTVPIWKKEIFEDGEVWVEGESVAKGLVPAD